MKRITAEKTLPNNETVFVVRLRADSEDSSIRALRWLLKTAKRQFGMTALSVIEEQSEVTPS
jgi:hypothetical protein